jgi:hypothetical protein
MKLKFGLLATLWSGRWISGDTCRQSLLWLPDMNGAALHYMSLLCDSCPELASLHATCNVVVTSPRTERRGVINK